MCIVIVSIVALICLVSGVVLYVNGLSQAKWIETQKIIDNIRKGKE